MGAPQNSHHRQPRGVREGGQFATRSNPESNVDLHEPDFDGIATAQAAARAYINRFGLSRGGVGGYLDADDFKQEAVMAFLEANVSERPGNKPMDDALITTVAKRAIVKAMSPSNNHRDYTAKVMFDEKRREIEKNLGGTLSPHEIEALAEEVRVSFPMSSRPNLGFHLASVKMRSLSDSGGWVAGGANGEGGRFVTDGIIARALTDPGVVDASDFAEGSVGDRATLLKMDGQQVAARALAWDAVAEHIGAPCVGEVIGKRAAIRARTEVTKGGGPIACAKRYLDEGTTNDGLFAPFGSIDDDAKYAVCDMLLRHEDYAKELWRVAISQAEGRAA